MKKIIFLFILITQLSLSAWAQQKFVVKQIEFSGLSNISSETAISYLPIKRGEVLEPAKTTAILKALYSTGFFDHISLSKKGSTLIIHVTERPTIGQLKISGNSVIPTDKLTAVMRTLDVAEGHTYNPAVLEKIKQSLLNQYYQLGRYNARVDIITTPMSRNRILVQVTISEGLVAKIRQITIIGNHVFSEKELIKQLDITTPGLYTFITQTDRYSEEKLEANNEKLRSFYMDHGYLRFEVKSSQAEVTPDRKSVYITIVVEEGQPYTIADYQLEGNLPVPKDEVLKLITISKGERFSRQKIIDSEKAINQFLGDKGYLFSTISLRPQINDHSHEVIVLFEANSGKRTYVRYVSFTDNTRTNDKVLRREVEQMEAAPASTSKLEESKHRLQLLPFLKDIEMAVNPVPGVDDQVDINYKVKEDSSAQASFKLGYSQLYKLILGIGLNQKNFLGTGNTLGINFQHSKFEQFYGIDYTDPYYTEDGISRTFSFNVSRVDPGAAGGGVISDYITNEYDLGVLYSIPVGQEVGVYNRILAGASYQQTLIKLVNTPSNQVNSFVTNHGRHFQEFDLRLGYSRSSLDRAIFPTRGTTQTVFLDLYAPLDGNSLSFYTFNYQGKWYQPLTHDFIFLTKANVGYGNGVHGSGDFPFFRNFFAGGINSVRGYEDLTLGPKDSFGKAYGANMLLAGSMGLIFPNFISENVRTSFFLDAGNVYSAADNRKFGGQSASSGPIRFSAGLEVDLLTPFGPIELSLGKAFARPHDETHFFQFALGSNF